MIDALVATGPDHAVTSFEIKEENVLYSEGKLSEAGLVENIAQTAAAHAGYMASQANEPVKTGFIGAISRLEIFDRPGGGEKIMTEIQVINQVFNVTIIEGKIKWNEKLIASCEMKIFIQ